MKYVLSVIHCWCVFVCLFMHKKLDQTPFNMKTFHFLQMSTCIRNYISVTVPSSHSGHLRASTINTLLLIFCAAVADNKASVGNTEGQDEGRATLLCSVTICMKAKCCTSMHTPPPLNTAPFLFSQTQVDWRIRMLLN